MNLQKLEQKVKKELTEKRFVHTLGVRYTAANLAMRYDADLEAAQVAGLLHDYCKCLEDKELLSMCQKRNLPVSEVERKSPYLLHGKLAAAVAREKFGIEDSDILGAITWHTTGREAMSVLEMILFTADYMEPGRRMIPGMEEVRRMAFLDLEETVYLILRNTLHYLDGDSEKIIDETTRDAYAYYQALHEEKYGRTGNQ